MPEGRGRESSASGKVGWAWNEMKVKRRNGWALMQVQIFAVGNRRRGADLENCVRSKKHLQFLQSCADPGSSRSSILELLRALNIRYSVSSLGNENYDQVQSFTSNVAAFFPLLKWNEKGLYNRYIYMVSMLCGTCSSQIFLLQNKTIYTPCRW